MQQIAEWLEKLGMSEYAQRFAENKIDVSVLRHLTDQDLKDIGVALGHRRKILAAIAEFAGAAPAVSKPVLSAEQKTRDFAERRQVTVLFSDLVGSTALAGRMDPEDLREVISGYQKCVAETVQRFGGFVANVLVYFGYPQAHEDDAERAVRAGLELVTAVNTLKTGPSLQARIGIATGLVVVGDLIGTGSAQEQTVVGETPNLAARLQGIAEPNTVVIAESTRSLLGNLFELQDLGTKDLKGLDPPVRASVVLRPASVESRFEALHASGLTELVGREEELEILLRRWSKAKAGQGQVVLLSGEAGIGKSRLSAALMERVAGEPHTRLRYFCSAQHTDSALEEFDEFAAAMAILDQRMDLAGDEVDAGQQADRAVTFIFMLTCEGRMHAGLGRQVGGGRCDGLYAGLLVVGNDRHRVARLLLRDGCGLLQDFSLGDKRTALRPSSQQSQDRAVPGSIALCAVSPLPGRGSCTLCPGRGWRGTHVPPRVHARERGGPEAALSTVRGDSQVPSPSGTPTTPAMPWPRE